jgi:hypothetical protein
MKTAVEWLIEQLKEYNHLSYDEQSWIFEQAKEMEKEQIIQAITKTIIGSNVIYGNEYPEVIHTAEQYYKETFKSE